jgi:hypothetical protein
MSSSYPPSTTDMACRTRRRSLARRIGNFRSADEMRLNTNIWGFLFGPSDFFPKGVWRKDDNGKPTDYDRAVNVWVLVPMTCALRQTTCRSGSVII